jgi:Tol biopolymer transport system component
VIAGKELRLSEILACTAQIADALAAAHSAGIIHRDLKPSNIMMTESGLVKVLDFGLAKLVSGPPGPGEATITYPRTDAGTVVGTPGYMSPEQVRGLGIDRSSDIFNLGLILYEMLAGKRAFRGETSVEVMNAILKEEPAELPEIVPGPLRQIVSVCLDKNPANRFESARDIGLALRALSAGTTISSAALKVDTVPERRKRKLAVPSALTLSIVTALVFAALYFLRQPAPLDLSPYQYTPFATDGGLETHGVWSPDGRNIAYLKQVGKVFQLMVRSLDAPLPTKLSNDGVSGLPFWSPDGNRIYCVADEKLWSVGVAGGAPQLIISDVREAALSRDGKTLALWKATEEKGEIVSSLWISSPPGSTPRKYKPAPFEYRGEFGPIYLHFSPDDKKIGLSFISTNDAGLWILDWPDGPLSKQRRVFADRSFKWGPSFDWLPDSRHLILGFEGSLWLGDMTTKRIQRLTAVEAAGHSHPSVSPDGRRIVFTAENIDYDIVEIPLDGSRPRPLISTARREFSPSWSSAGDRMAYITDKSGTDEIWLRSVSGDWERPIVTQKDFPDETGSRLFTAALSPDGSRVAYARGTSQATGKLWVSSAAGGKPMLVFPSAHPYEYQPSWSPDGSSLACVTYKDRSELAVVRVGSQEPPFYFPDAALGQPAWSPDGRWIAFLSNNQADLILLTPDGKSSLKLPSPVKPEQDFVMVWSRDSSRIYSFLQSDTAQLLAVDVKTGKATKVADFEPGIELRFYIYGGLSASLCPGAKSLVTSVQVRKSDLWILDGFPQPGRRR